MTERILLSHGGGGEMSARLLREIFFPEFGTSEDAADDAARVETTTGKIAFTTDSFVVSPAFFKGGDIGKLAVCGTVNDLCCAGAAPRYLSCGFIIEEGFETEKLKKIVHSMALTARECGASIAAGDTKVVPRGAADGIYINTSGIGEILPGMDVSGRSACAGDRIIASGTLGLHGCAILLERELSPYTADVQSDCAPVLPLLLALQPFSGSLHTLRDPTRGGLAAVANEIARQSGTGMEIREDAVPVPDAVRAVCAAAGLDPLSLACEGRLIAIAEKGKAQEILDIWHRTPGGEGAAIIGEVCSEHAGIAALVTRAGVKRVLRMPSGEMLPRIC
jgi:hydrogenase expression/formation protein HypE